MNMPWSSLLAILLENLRPLAWPFAGLLVLEVAILLRLWTAPRPLPIIRGIAPAAVVGLLVALAVFLLTPGFTQADFSALSGWLDWGSLTLLAFGSGLLAMLYAWPWAVWWRLRGT
ncbi:MAG: hypothetical protein RML12_04020 [Xanthomonadales bacterium]|nr:hypothetical protein [Xanthomonadales bacterium]